MPAAEVLKARAPSEVIEAADGAIGAAAKVIGAAPKNAL